MKHPSSNAQKFIHWFLVGVLLYVAVSVILIMTQNS